jgi:hypothetical protein
VSVDNPLQKIQLLNQGNDESNLDFDQQMNGPTKINKGNWCVYTKGTADI